MLKTCLSPLIGIEEGSSGHRASLYFAASAKCDLVLMPELIISIARIFQQTMDVSLKSEISSSKLSASNFFKLKFL